MTSYDKPTNDQIESAVPLLSSPQHEGYFFAKLENPYWIAPLEKRGLFDHPPKAHMVKGGGIRFPIWPASKYLARMAVHVPFEVSEIFARIDTDNSTVIGDMVSAALVMPSDAAATLAPSICRAAAAGTLWVYLKDAADLCASLAANEEVPAALKLAEQLFRPGSENKQQVPGRRDEYWYKEGLSKVLPVLVTQEPPKFLLMLCNWLRILIDAKKQVDPSTGSDHSYLWRPAIEEHGQNRDHDIAGRLVGFVRQGFELVIQSGRFSFADAMGLTAKYSYLVFKRIRVHLINEFADENIDLARQTMMDRTLFDNYRFKHEYAMLVGRRLNLLSVKKRNAWFGWVDGGPDLSAFDEDEDKRRKQVRYWKFQKLYCVREHLEGKWQSFYDEMLAEHGTPELADLNTHFGVVRFGNESPMTAEELAMLSFEDAVKSVSNWKAKESRHFGPNIEGLAATFEQYVATNPEKFSKEAQKLEHRPAIFVRVFISQMSEAIKADRDVAVRQVLDLCRWVLEQPVDERTTPESDAGAVVDTDWRWTREDVSRFVEIICKAESGAHPKYPIEDFRESLWQLLEKLYRDRSKSNILHDTSQDDPRVRDYLDLGINSPRGRAVEAGLEYARWVWRQLKDVENDQADDSGGFESMPEVRKMLEWQIAPANRSFEVMAVIGSRIDVMNWIDKDWLGGNATKLFHLEGWEEPSPQPHGWAAWNAFLVWNSPHFHYYEIFRKQFAYAVAQSASVELSDRVEPQPMTHLGEHLMLFYGRGQLGFDDDDGLLQRFLATASPDIRRHAIGFVGGTLGGEQQIPDAVVDRFKSLWEHYWTTVGKKDVTEKPDAQLFGTWFSSGKFPAEWSLDQLASFVEVTPTPEPDHAIVEHLAANTDFEITGVVRILDRIIRGDGEGWRIHGWQDSAKQILKRAVVAGGDARYQAEKTIDHLGRRGYTDFGDLLDQ